MPLNSGAAGADAQVVADHANVLPLPVPTVTLVVTTELRPDPVTRNTLNPVFTSGSNVTGPETGAAKSIEILPLPEALISIGLLIPVTRTVALATDLSVG